MSIVSLIDDTRKAVAVDEHCPVLDLFKNPVPVTRAIATSATAVPAEL